MTAIANWLNTAFAEFDYAILECYHLLAEHAGVILTPFLKLISLFGEKGLLGIVVGLICLLFRKTRKTGVCVLGAVVVGAIITNLTVKDLVARPRPFQSEILDFAAWWQYIGAPSVGEFSFPSGHTTSAVASMTALCFLQRKWKVMVPAISFAVLTGISRNYLMVHYPTDVIAGAVVGLCSALISLGVTLLLFHLLECKKDTRLVGFILNADIRDCFQKKQEG